MSIKIKVDINRKRYLVQLFLLILKLQNHKFLLIFILIFSKINIDIFWKKC